MRKIDFWCLKHKLLAFILLTFSLTFCGGLILYLFSAPVWALIVYAVLTLLLNLVYVNFCYAKGVQNAIVDFNNCDPYPLYEIGEKVLPYVKGINEQELILNKTSSLFCMGEYEKMLEILEDLNIDKIAGTPIQYKIVYYNNMASAYESLGRMEEAATSYKKVKRLCNDAPPKIKENYKNVIISADIFDLKAEEKYEEALRLNEERIENDLLQKIDAAMERAELFIAMNQYEKAKLSLKFVYMNANKTYYVKKAQDMYNELEAL